MSYIDPKTVTSPKGLVSDVEVVFNTGRKENSWSIATLKWDNQPAVGIRWNGDEESGVGNPQSRGNPTWFIVPEELAEQVLKQAEMLARRTHQSLAAAYGEMANDHEREAEAEEWCEGLIGNATPER